MSHGSTPPSTSPPGYCHIFPSSTVNILLTKMLLVITFTSDKGFGLVDIGQKKVVGHTAVGRKEDDSNAVTHNIHGTSFSEQHIAKPDIKIFNVSEEVANSLHKNSLHSSAIVIKFPYIPYNTAY
jgi:hypothetical protein